MKHKRYQLHKTSKDYRLTILLLIASLLSFIIITYPELIIAGVEI